ncbi:MAG: SH3 domain-containing protein [Polyangiales bacterium]
MSIIGGGEVCEGRVVRARELHALEALHGQSGQTPRSWTFLGLEFSGCDGGNLGVAGTAVRAHDLRRQNMRTPATAELISLVRPYDDDLWEAPIPSDEFRMLRFPHRGITVVAGSSAWVVRGGEVLDERFHGFPVVLVEAGSETFFEMSAPSESWAASLDDFLPPSASCVVADTSGTPLNVRDSPGSRTVIDTLENDTPVRVVESRGAWRRLEDRGQAWVHQSGLRCRQPG